MMGHPLQEVLLDEYGTIRCKENKIVRFLLDAGPFDLNQLALMPFSDEDREQLAQLLGYSVTGLDELSYMSESVMDELLGKREELLRSGKRSELI